eukprot:766023-Hanusia_phi.AAC.1
MPPPTYGKSEKAMGGWRGDMGSCFFLALVARLVEDRALSMEPKRTITWHLMSTPPLLVLVPSSSLSDSLAPATCPLGRAAAVPRSMFSRHSTSSTNVVKSKDEDGNDFIIINDSRGRGKDQSLTFSLRSTNRSRTSRHSWGHVSITVRLLCSHLQTRANLSDGLDDVVEV